MNNSKGEMKLNKEQKFNGRKITERITNATKKSKIKKSDGRHKKIERKLKR